MYIYRIQNILGKGPYVNTIQTWRKRDHDTKKHPNPWEDTIHLTYICREKWKCGFTSLEQLCKWFSKKEIINLYNLGFYITKLRINKEYIKEGKKQIVFEPNKVTSTKSFNEETYKLIINLK